MCVNKGIKVLVTTHSDYFIQEINNLIMLNQNFEGKEDFMKKQYNDRGMILSKNQVSGFICENGFIKECKKDKFGIKMENFDTTIAEINKISRHLTATITNGDDE